MSKRYCFGNWKLNKSVAQSQKFLKDLKEQFQAQENVELALFPSAPLSFVFKQGLASGVCWGPQNISYQKEGAYTGESSVEVFKELGASYVLVGHSERRSLFKETAEELHQKIKLAQQTGLTVVYCIGETLEQKEAGQTLEVLERQIQEGLRGADLSRVILAYEPVWAIGTGKSAEAKDLEIIFKELKDRVPDASLPILYGGSVKEQNSKELIEIPGIDGFLIGGASLKLESLLAIYKTMGA